MGNRPQDRDEPGLTRPVIRRASRLPVPEREYGAHQLRVVPELDRQWRSPGRFRGVLMLPTGAGKTYTAVRWLTENVLDQGIRVLWLTHRVRLLTQAAHEFINCIGYLRRRRDEDIALLTASGDADQHLTPAGASEHLDQASVVLWSMHGLRSAALREWAKGQREVFVVIDEAHHATAGSYVDFLKDIGAESGERHHLLGLTATPTRTNEREIPKLNKLFGGNYFGREVTVASLVSTGFLASPRLVIIESALVQKHFALRDDEKKRLRLLDSLPVDALARFWHDSHRAALIIRDYLSRSRRPRAIVFAVSQDAAIELEEEFTKEKVKARAVIAERASETEASIKRFRLPAEDPSHLDVLITVNILTEGVDVPECGLVYLARPTKSRILFQQMVGRALRGVHARGNAEALLVHFDDGAFERYADWAGPFDVFRAEELGDEARTRERVVRERKRLEEIGAVPPQVLAALRDLRRALLEDVARTAETGVAGWYEFEVEHPEVSDRIDEASGASVGRSLLTRHLLVFEGQRPNYQTLASPPHDVDLADAALGGKVARSDLEAFAAHCRAFGEPTFNPLPRARELLPVSAIAAQLLDAGIPESCEQEWLSAFWERSVLHAETWPGAQADFAEAVRARIETLIDPTAETNGLPAERARRLLDLQAGAPGSLVRTALRGSVIHVPTDWKGTWPPTDGPGWWRWAHHVRQRVEPFASARELNLAASVLLREAPDTSPIGWRASSARRGEEAVSPECCEGDWIFDAGGTAYRANAGRLEVAAPLRGRTGQVAMTPFVPSTKVGLVQRLAISPVGEWCVVAGASASAEILEPCTRGRMALLSRIGGVVESVRASSCGKRFLVATKKRLLVWSVDDAFAGGPPLLKVSVSARDAVFQAAELSGDAEHVFAIERTGQGPCRALHGRIKSSTASLAPQQAWPGERWSTDWARALAPGPGATVLAFDGWQLFSVEAGGQPQVIFEPAGGFSWSALSVAPAAGVIFLAGQSMTYALRHPVDQPPLPRSDLQFVVKHASPDGRWVSGIRKVGR